MVPKRICNVGVPERAMFGDGHMLVLSCGRLGSTGGFLRAGG
jgi:hypothetical protein